MSPEPERWRKMTELFDRAQEVPEAERSTWLRERCGDDEALYRSVASLLASDEQAGSFMPSLAPTPVSTPPTDGRRIGPYRLIRQLAEGGMGSVYLAARADESFEREVVLKLIRQGMESSDTRQRLRIERQVLAQLEHPNIARLYDGGTTAEDQPYFVMEWVDGLPVDEFCETGGLGFDQRIELFQKICGAVHCAHQSLVVHRDLKPSNILVTRDGEPKLLDFGIAKPMGPGTATEAAVTLPWARWLTPDYASPEQLLGRHITTASDVYSLGVLLCQLMTGELPRRFERLDPAGILEAVAERPATRPSELLRRRQQRTGKELPGRWSRELLRDLDTIVLKALDEDPRRRYASAEQLAEDLERLRRGFPVRARPNSAAYRLRKFLRRHRLAVAASAAAVTMLIAGILALAVQSARITRERDQLRAVVGFVKEVFRVAGEGEDLTVRQAVDRSAVMLDRKLSAQPEVRATLLDTAGTIYLNLWAIDPALQQLRQAAEIRRQVYGETSERTAESLSSLGLALAFKGEIEEGESLARYAYALYRRRFGDHHPQLVPPLNNLVTLLCFKGDFAAVAEPSAQALALARELLPEESEALAIAVSNRALALTKEGQLAPAVELYREALELHRGSRGEDHPDVAMVLNNLASVLRRQGQLEEAEGSYQHALVVMRRLFGDEHPRLSLSLNNLASLQLERGDAATAAETYRAARDLVRAAHGPASAGHLVTSSGLASALVASGDAPAAEALLSSHLELWRESLGDSWLVAYAESALGATLTALGRYPEAEELLLVSYPRIRAAQGDASPKTRVARRRLHELYTAWGRPEKEAELGLPAFDS